MKIEQFPSPNFHTDPARKITAVILHATATSGLASPKSWLCDTKSKASAHYLIDRDGTVYQLVQEKDVAWHAGVSEWHGLEHTNPATGVKTMNNCSIGIELVDANDGTPHPEPQLAACAELVAAACKKYDVSPADVVRHLDVAPGRKTDPAGLDLANFRERLAIAGVV